MFCPNMVKTMWFWLLRFTPTDPQTDMNEFMFYKIFCPVLFSATDDHTGRLNIATMAIDIHTEALEGHLQKSQPRTMTSHWATQMMTAHSSEHDHNRSPDSGSTPECLPTSSYKERYSPKPQRKQTLTHKTSRVWRVWMLSLSGSHISGTHKPQLVVLSHATHTCVHF